MVALAFESLGIRKLPQGASLFSRQPVAKANAQFFRSPDPAYARCEFRAQQPKVGRLVSETAHRCESDVDGSWCQLASLEVDSVAGYHALVEGEARFRAIPTNELVDGMVIPALRLR